MLVLTLIPIALSVSLNCSESGTLYSNLYQMLWVNAMDFHAMGPVHVAFSLHQGYSLEDPNSASFIQDTITIA